MCGSGYPIYPKILPLLIFFLQILKFEENIIRKKIYNRNDQVKKKTKPLCMLEHFLFNFARKGIKTLYLKNNFYCIFIVLYIPKLIYAYQEKK